MRIRSPRSARARLAMLAAMGASAAVVLAPGAQAASRSAASSTSRFATISASLPRTSDASIGELHRSAMSIEVVLAPSHGSQLSGLLRALYNPSSSSYRHWLRAGQFTARFAPAAAERAAVIRYLRSSGLAVQASSSPFYVRAVGSSAQMDTTFRTDLRTFRDRRGLTYFSNATSLHFPASIARGVISVVGLSNTVRPKPGYVLRHGTVQLPLGIHGGQSGCETSYPTTAQLYAEANNGTQFPFGYGGGPGCSGLTPSQTNSIYDAPYTGPRGQGSRANLAVFELSAYQPSDVQTWARQFYGRRYQAPLVDINIDGGPLNPACPANDTCLPASQAYAGDIEVAADIEQTLSISPDAGHVLVYNAPNDYSGQTELDEYSAIAQQDVADTISSSWLLCENDAGAAYAEAENEIFEQMAAQGQSMFAAAGDTGAFGCIRDGTGSMVNVGDPSTQPWVTSVGGTSLERYNPGRFAFGFYPQGVETVWNVDNLCNNSTNEGGQTGIFWCTNVGAGGGGVSQFWQRPAYQTGPGVNNPYTVLSDGTTQCPLTPNGTTGTSGIPCREVPDISADADENTPYAEYCTGTTTSTPGSVCATLGSIENVPGWFGIGGTSLSSPLWSAIIGDRDSFIGYRAGNANELLYALFDGYRYNRFFHDITGYGQSTNNNGLYPTTPGYDMATGIGTPDMSALITKR